VSKSEKRHFHQLCTCMCLAVAFAVLNNVLIVLAHDKTLRVPPAYVGALTAFGALALNMGLYVVAALFFFLLRIFADNMNLKPWRESSRASRGGVGLLVEFFSLDRLDRPGSAWAFTAILAVVYTLTVNGLALASPNLTSSVLPRTTHLAKGPPKNNGSTSSVPGPASSSTADAITSPGTTPEENATTSTEPEVDPGCSNVRARLINDLPVITDVSVAREYSNHHSALQCVVLDANGRAATTTWSRMTAVEFTLADRRTPTGSIVFNSAGDASTLLTKSSTPSDESRFADAVEQDDSVHYLSPIIEVHGAQLRIAERDDARCFVELRPDSETGWNWYPPSLGPPALALFLALHQVPRPVGDHGFRFTYPTPEVTLTATNASAVVVNGLTESLARTIATERRCPDIATIQAAQPDGPPAR
jgi:hypothetical protein